MLGGGHRRAQPQQLEHVRHHHVAVRGLVSTLVSDQLHQEPAERIDALDLYPGAVRQHERLGPQPDSELLPEGEQHPSGSGSARRRWAGYSTAKPGVSDGTRQAVLTALDVLGYERSTQLRGVRARLVGLVLPELQNPIFPALAEVAGGALVQLGFTPVLCTRTAAASPRRST